MGKLISKTSLVAVLVIAFFVTTICRSSANKNDFQTTILEGKNNHTEDLEQFASAIAPTESAFHKSYETSKRALGDAINVLEKEGILDAAFQTSALQNTKRAQRKLREFKNELSAWKNSSNSHIQTLSKEYLAVLEHAKKILEEHYNFISAPNEYIESPHKIDKFREHTVLLNEQYDHLQELFQKAAKFESTKSDSSAKPVVIQFSKDEEKAMTKWKKKTIAEMVSDASNGDAAALHMVGMCHVYGQGGFPINIKNANTYFAASASLGFAPSIDQIKSMYLEDNPNVFLALVYVNLLASSGHREFVMAYHNQRAVAAEKFGPELVNEIERITTEKRKKILNNARLMEKTTDKIALTADLLYGANGITSEDEKYGMEYWEKIFEKRTN